MRFFKQKNGKEVFAECEITNGLENYVEVLPNTVDAAVEKHIPVIEINQGVVKVSVGEVIHPMTEPHYIEWISLQTEQGYKKVDLTPNDEPVVNFKLESGDKPIKAYEHCNLHGLWGKNI